MRCPIQAANSFYFFFLPAVLYYSSVLCRDIAVHVCIAPTPFPSHPCLALITREYFFLESERVLRHAIDFFSSCLLFFFASLSSCSFFAYEISFYYYALGVVSYDFLSTCFSNGSRGSCSIKSILCTLCVVNFSDFIHV